jgi:hypothetical protein
MSQDRTFDRMDAVLELEAQLRRYKDDATPHGKHIYEETLQNLKRDLEVAIHAGEGDWFTERYQQYSPGS